MTMRFILPLLASVVVGCAGADDGSSGPTGSPSNPGDIAQSESQQNEVGRVSSHGSVLVGTPEAAFLSHIPLFENPHDVQVIVSGSFVTDGGPAASASPSPSPSSPPSSAASPSLPGSLPPSFNDRLFTFAPSSQFSLDALRLGTLREIKGTIFLGNFESGGRPVVRNARFVVSKVIHQHILDKNEKLTDLSYILFGTREATFAAHHIAGSSTFDEVVRVDLGQAGPSDSELASGVDIKVTGKADDTAERLGLGVAPRNVVAGTRTFTIRPSKMLSCLVGPDFFTACD